MQWGLEPFCGDRLAGQNKERTETKRDCHREFQGSRREVIGRRASATLRKLGFQSKQMSNNCCGTLDNVSLLTGNCMVVAKQMAAEDQDVPSRWAHGSDRK